MSIRQGCRELVQQTVCDQPRHFALNKCNLLRASHGKSKKFDLFCFVGPFSTPNYSGIHVLKGWDSTEELQEHAYSLEYHGLAT